MRFAPARLLTAALIAHSVLAAGCDATVDSSDPAGAADSERALSSNEKTAYNYFVSQGLTGVQAAGIVGNFIQESGVSPTIAQYGGGPGRGIAQWSTGGRWDTDANDNVTAYADAHGLSRWDLNTQLEFTWYELTTYSGYGLSELRASTTVSAATVVFMTRFEACGTCAQSARIADANTVLSEAGGSTSSSGGGSSTAPTSGADCYSATLGADEPDNTCVQSKYDDDWYQCDDGDWVDRWSDPAACASVHPL